MEACALRAENSSAVLLRAAAVTAALAGLTVANLRVNANESEPLLYLQPKP